MSGSWGECTPCLSEFVSTHSSSSDWFLFCTRDDPCPQLPSWRQFRYLALLVMSTHTEFSTDSGILRRVGAHYFILLKEVALTTRHKPIDVNTFPLNIQILPYLFFFSPSTGVFLMGKEREGLDFRSNVTFS